MRKFIAGSVMAALMAGSTVAQAAPVAVDNVRVGSTVSESEMLGGSSMLLGLVGLAVLVFIIIEIADDNNKDMPVSV